MLSRTWITQEGRRKYIVSNYMYMEVLEFGTIDNLMHALEAVVCAEMYILPTSAPAPDYPTSNNLITDSVN